LPGLDGDNATVTGVVLVGAVTVTFGALSSMVCRVMRSSPPETSAISRSSSRSGSFISQCARRRSNSACGPPFS
jgi:hypothetical protein